MAFDLLGGNATSKGDEDNMNRLGGWVGAMAQARVGVEADTAISSSDRQTAEYLGRYVGEFARTIARRKRPL